MFLGGMNQELKKLVATCKPIFVLDAYNLVKLHEEALLADYSLPIYNDNPITNHSPIRNQYQPQTFASTQHKANNHQTIIKQPAITSLNPKPGRKIFNNEDYEERRMKNLCFWCDEEYSHNHKCEKKNLYNLQVATTGEEPEIFHEATKFPEEEEEDGDNDQRTTLYAINGEPVYNTFKISGQVKEKSILILFDSGSTHNIVSTKLV